MIKGIDCAHPAGLYGRHNNAEGPGNPNDILYAIQLSSLGFPVLDHETDFLKTGSRTGPPAERSAQKKRQDKQKSKHEEAADDESLRSPLDDQVRREVIEGDWEEQKGEKDESLSDSLSFFDSENPFWNSISVSPAARIDCHTRSVL